MGSSIESTIISSNLLTVEAVNFLRTLEKSLYTKRATTTLPII